MCKPLRLAPGDSWKNPKLLQLLDDEFFLSGVHFLVFGESFSGSFIVFFFAPRRTGADDFVGPTCPPALRLLSVEFNISLSNTVFLEISDSDLFLICVLSFLRN